MIKITPAERMRLWRRKNGLTVAHASTMLGRSKYYITKVEAGTIPPAYVPPIIMTLADCCWIYRRRSHFTLVQVSALRGVSRVTQIAQESGRTDPTSLCTWWQEKFTSTERAAQ